MRANDMRAVVQRVSRASVSVDGAVIGAIGTGLMVLLGVADGDTEADATQLADKCAHLRIFGDDQRKMNRSVLDVGGRVLSISQFTLYGDCRKGRRPSFVQAAGLVVGQALYDAFNLALRSHGLPVETGRFGAMMAVELVNDGPVTILLDTADFQRLRRG